MTLEPFEMPIIMPHNERLKVTKSSHYESEAEAIVEFIKNCRELNYNTPLNAQIIYALRVKNGLTDIEATNIVNKALLPEESTDLMTFEISGITSDVPNLNGIIYPKEYLQKAVNDFNEKIKTETHFVHIGRDEPSTNLTDAIASIKKCSIENDKMYIQIEPINTPNSLPIIKMLKVDDCEIVPSIIGKVDHDKTVEICNIAGFNSVLKPNSSKTEDHITDKLFKRTLEQFYSNTKVKTNAEKIKALKWYMDVMFVSNCKTEEEELEFLEHAFNKGL